MMQWMLPIAHKRGGELQAHVCPQFPVGRVGVSAIHQRAVSVASQIPALRLTTQFVCAVPVVLEYQPMKQCAFFFRTVFLAFQPVLP